jgi:hypothetical protein
MWNDRKSVVLSKICVFLFMFLLAAALAAPWVYAPLLRAVRRLDEHILVTVYAGAVPVVALLVLLLALLRRVERGEVFVRENVASLRYISWCCFFGAGVAAVSTAYYMPLPWAVFALAAAFMGLIVRVVKNVFAKAVALQDDADFTV